MGILDILNQSAIEDAIKKMDLHHKSLLARLDSIESSVANLQTIKDEAEKELSDTGKLEKTLIILRDLNESVEHSLMGRYADTEHIENISRAGAYLDSAKDNVEKAKRLLGDANSQFA